MNRKRNDRNNLFIYVMEAGDTSGTKRKKGCKIR